jgi:hypothetical protein
MNRRLACTAMLLLFATIAMADGDGPTRNMNPAENAAYGSVQKTIRSALSVPLPNYTASFSGFEDRYQIFEGMKSDQMFRMDFAVKHTVSPEFEQKQASASVMNRTKGTPQQQEKMAELNSKDAELKKARDKTRDRAEKDRIRAELKTVHEEQNRLSAEINAQIQAWAASGGGVTAQQETVKGLPPKEFNVRLRPNQDVRISDHAKPYPLAGYQTSFEQSEGCVDFDSYCITVLLGPFEKGKRISGSTQYTLRNTPLGVPTKPRGLMLVVSGPKEKPEKVKELLGEVDLGRLNAMLP